jgi:hypothetical protein
MKVNGMKQRFFKVLAATVALGALLLPGVERSAQAQEILLTGPLAGAPAVRKQRLYRAGRLEIAPSVSFTLLDEYERLILIGARLNYNITDWLAIGGWGAYSLPALKLKTDLAERIQDVNTARQQQTAAGGTPGVDHKLTRINLSRDFREQLGTIDWVAAPQLTLVPFRGKIGVFQSIYVDTDFYIFGGPAFIGRTERADCGGDSGAACGPVGDGAPGSIQFEMAQSMTIAPTFGLGFQFYVSKWGAIGAEWRGLPFSRNTGGFDNHGGGPNGEFPDLQVDDRDREFKFNQMITISFGVSLPFDYQVSE